jgi:hypothetical protein
MTNHPGYQVQLLSPEETEQFLAAMRTSPELRSHRRTMVLSSGLEVKGEFELIARDVRSDEIEWRHTQENLITDYGRRAWMDYRLSTLRLAFAPSKETPQIGRTSLSTDPTQTIVSGNLTPSNNPATNTKTLSTTFGTPSANRTLGTIILGSINVSVNANIGYTSIVAYSLLTPPRIQTTTQTLEVVYKISMNPIF